MAKNTRDNPCPTLLFLGTFWLVLLQKLTITETVMFKKNALLRALIAAGLTTGLAACGGGSSSADNATVGDDGSGGGGEQTTPSTSSPGPDAKLKGQFVDSPVQGLRYSTASNSGVTNADGEYEYRNGEEVAFYIGNSLLGQTLAGPVITPIEMADESSNADRVTNILRFLQTMDNDDDPSNGIILSENAIALAETDGVAIDFEQTAAAFESSVGNFLSTVSRSNFVSAEDAQNHFNETLAKNEVDIRGEWISTSSYFMNGVEQKDCESSGTWIFTDTEVSFEGQERNSETNDDGSVSCTFAPFNYSATYNDPNLQSSPGAGCIGGTCTLDQLNRVIDRWDYRERTDFHEGNPVQTKLYAVVEVAHKLGSDTMVRIKTSKTEFNNPETGESGTNTYGVSKTVLLKKEAAEYTKDMRGTWTVTSRRASCPDTNATHTIKYSDTGITVVGEELNRRDGVCLIENMNESLSYDDPELPAEFCGPTCTWRELNGTYSDEGDTIKLSHKRGTDVINRTKGFDSRGVWVKQ